MLISQIKPNPENPRIIKDHKFKQLVESIKSFPQMLELRPIVIDENNVVLGGNMRLKACIEAGLTDVPVVQAKDLTDLQKKEFIVKDNVGYGEWDWDDLANNWDEQLLTEWGLDIPNFAIAPSEDELIGNEKNNPPTIKITFASIEELQCAEADIIELIDRKYPKAYFSVSAGEL
jgi:ParB-like chromosome segregation protein Spo0J